MAHPVQEELFSPEQYTRICSRCRREFPRTSVFFPQGRTKDGMATICRQCTHFKIPGDSQGASRQPSPVLGEEKVCEDCVCIKPLTEFFMDSHTLDGKSRWCKTCSNTRYQAGQERRERLGEDAWAVYFIQDTRNLRVKIGCSANPYESFLSLQQGSSVSLRLLTVLEAGIQSDAESRERELHRLFESCYEGNGWFECVSSLQQYIALIQQKDGENKSTLANSPPLRARARRNHKHPGAVRVEGQIFPSLTAATAATGYSPEQIELLGPESGSPFSDSNEA